MERRCGPYVVAKVRGAKVKFISGGQVGERECQPYSAAAPQGAFQIFEIKRT
jgi:hypothetical protein